jgi:hypothetical protein
LPATFADHVKIPKAQFRNLTPCKHFLGGTLFASPVAISINHFISYDLATFFNYLKRYLPTASYLGPKIRRCKFSLERKIA